MLHRTFGFTLQILNYLFLSLTCVDTPKLSSETFSMPPVGGIFGRIMQMPWVMRTQFVKV